MRYFKADNMLDPKIKKILFSSILLVFLLTGITGLAQDRDLEQLPDTPILGEGGVLDRVYNYLFWIFIIAATISILVSGFYFITAAGDPEKFHKAKMMVLYALIGVLIAFSSRGLVSLIKEIAGGEGGEEGGRVTSCSGYCSVQGKGGGNCVPECGYLWGRHFPGGDSFCPSTAPQCCCD